MSKALITEAEFFRDAFKAHDNEWVNVIMWQFVDDERRREPVGIDGWKWKLGDKTNLIVTRDGLIAVPSLGDVQ